MTDPSPDDGLKDLAAAIREGTEAFTPAANAIASLDARLDALCNWLKTAKPYAIAFGIWAVTKFVPDLAEALGPLLQSMVPAS